MRMRIEAATMNLDQKVVQRMRIEAATKKPNQNVLQRSRLVPNSAAVTGTGHYNPARMHVFSGEKDRRHQRQTFRSKAVKRPENQANLPNIERV
jgi:hypothetical protein